MVKVHYLCGLQAMEVPNPGVRVVASDVTNEENTNFFFYLNNFLTK